MQGNSRIVGKITAMDGKTPVVGATVIAYHLSTKAFFNSGPSDEKGAYAIEGLVAGYYDLAVQTPEGLFVGSSIVNVAPARKSIANFSVIPFSAPAAGTTQDRPFPGAEGNAAGAAKIEERLTTREFWRTPKGVAVLAGGGTAVLLAVVTSSGETAVSAF